MTTIVRSSALALGLLGATALCSTAHAALMASASLYTPQLPSGTTNTVIDLQGISTPSQAPVVGSGYSLTFSVAGDQGVVQGTAGGVHATPVAGVSGGNATYLTGNFGSGQTTDVTASGNYLSTGTGTITLTFDAPQTSLALLWGSIDTGNVVTFGNAAGDTLTGATVQGLASGFVSNGFQGPGGSAYVVANSDTPFSTVTFSSNVVSFEFAGVVASEGMISNVPLPASAPLFGAALVALGAVGYGLQRKKGAAAA
jgi:hypothetical protein